MSRAGDAPHPLSPPIRMAGWRFALLAIYAAALLLLPPLSRARFDPSIFIVAGDRFVDAGATRAPIIVRPHSAGYDGQFYYAMALDPAAPASRAGGVSFDHPAWRWQRIFYPLLAFAVSFGHARALPAAMLGINLMCVAALAWLARRAAGQWGRGGLPIWAFMLWPGFLVSLTHDTTELLACACLLGAVLAWRADRLAAFAGLAICATLTRETSSLMLAGLAVGSLRAGRRASWGLPPRRALVAAACLVPVLLWHVWLGHVWPDAEQAAPMHANLGLPFVGLAERLAISVRDAAALHGRVSLLAAYAAATAAGIIAFSVWVVAALPALMRRGGQDAAIGVGWLCMMALVSLLSARGPWIDPTAIDRAFSECWVVGWLILVLGGARTSALAGAAVLPLAFMNWRICLVQLQ